MMTLLFAAPFRINFMKTFSITLGKPFGIPTTIHWTFWILIIWIIYANASQGQGRAEILWYILFVFSIFACVVLHELGHAIAARRYGIQTRSITILPIGGVASLEKIPEDPKQELVVAVAGPLVNVVIATGLWLFLSATGKLSLGMESLEEVTHINGSNFFIALLSVNLLLVLFNLIPAFPMDGGRMFRALLAFKMSRVKATEWAVNVGTFFAVLFVFWGFSNNPFLIFIALFIFLSAQSELNHVRTESFLHGYKVGDILMQDYTILQSTDPLKHAVEVLLNGQEERFLVANEQTIIGTLSKTNIIKGLTDQGEEVLIGKVMNPELVWLTTEDSLQHAQEMMMQKGANILPVGTQQMLDGVVDIDNLNEFLLIRKATSHKKSMIGDQA
ncbi:MAG: protease [Saprospiraceae bacterium]|nr:MAG: protease [Saprospiraceae bacterium]